MSQKFDGLVNTLVDSIKTANSKKTSGYSTDAVVKRIDGNTAWVHIDGGYDETPVELTIDAKIGDVVKCQVEGGRAWIIGNQTAPPTDDSKATKVEQDLKNMHRLVKVVESIAGSASKIATSINQYFWHVESGSTDNGAHITQIPKEEFLADPENGGGNLLATSQGIAVRDGVTDLATFDSEGFDVYKNGTGVAHFGTDIRLGETSENLTLSSSPYGYNMSLNYDSNVRAQISVSQYELALQSLGTNRFVGSAILLGSRINSSNQKYGDISINVREENGDGFYLNMTPKGLYAQGKAKVLWSGGSTGKYMTDTQSVELNETISEQLNGIMLVWSRYANGTTYNDSWSYDFVPKWHVIYHDGGGVYCSMPIGLTSNTVCNKYVYIHELSMAGPANITGHADNASTGTGYANNTRVLRAVLGV